MCLDARQLQAELVSGKAHSHKHEAKDAELIKNAHATLRQMEEDAKAEVTVSR